MFFDNDWVRYLTGLHHCYHRRYVVLMLNKSDIYQRLTNTTKYFMKSINSILTIFSCKWMSSWMDILPANRQLFQIYSGIKIMDRSQESCGLNKNDKCTTINSIIILPPGQSARPKLLKTRQVTSRPSQTWRPTS